MLSSSGLMAFRAAMIFPALPLNFGPMVFMSGVTTVFFTFMGLNAIRKGWAKKIKFQMPGFMGAIPGMATMATGMMKKKIDKAGIPGIEDMMDMAQAEGVKFVACKMTVDMMELSEDAFIDGVEIMTAEDYMKLAKSAKLNMFI